MREILFRAFSKKTGMIEISDNSKVTLDFNKISGWNIIPNIPNYKGEYLAGESQSKTKDFVLMQFTGLKDKNGFDIYDSDIVRLNGWGFNGQDDGLTKIIWDNDVIGWNFEKSNYAEDRYDFRKAINNCEVVGNIYSNPDLLT